MNFDISQFLRKRFRKPHQVVWALVATAFAVGMLVMDSFVDPISRRVGDAVRGSAGPHYRHRGF